MICLRCCFFSAEIEKISYEHTMWALRKEETSLLFKTEEVISLPFFHSFCFAYNARSLSSYLIVNQHDLKPLKCKLFIYAVLYKTGRYKYLNLGRKYAMERSKLLYPKCTCVHVKVEYTQVYLLFVSSGYHFLLLFDI